MNPTTVRAELVEARPVDGGTPFDKLRANRKQQSLLFGGYAALFDRLDRAGDVFRVGAFGGAGPVPLLWQHRGAAVGELTAVREDARGLWVEGVVRDPEAARLVRSGALPGLSVGYRSVRARQGAWRELLAVELIEVSLVAVPMQPGARVEVIEN